MIVVDPPRGPLPRSSASALLAGAMVFATFASAPASAQCTQPTPVTAASCEAAKTYHRAQGGVSLLVWVNGQTVCEDYTAMSGPGVSFEIWSGTKSFSAMTAAIAIAEGTISSWDEALVGTFPEWQSDPRKSRITLRQLLGLISGIQQSGEPTYAESVGYPAIHEPGTTFEYGSVAYTLFGEFLRRKLAGQYADPLAYMQAKIFQPIGATYAGWNRLSDGMPQLAWGSQWTARQWIKYGELVRLGGFWPPTEQSLAPQEFLDHAFHGSAPNPNYGLTWWMRTPTGSPPCDLVRADGLGSQKLYVIRSLGLVAVRQTNSPFAGLNYNDYTFIDHLIAPTNWQDDCPPAPASAFTVAKSGPGGGDLAFDWAAVNFDALGRNELVGGYDVFSASNPSFTGETLVASSQGATSAVFAPGAGGPPTSGSITYYRVRARDKCGNLGP